MSEAEWLATKSLVRMQVLLRPGANRKGRKWRFFGCACVRRIWQLLPEESASRAAMEVCELYADGLNSAEQLIAARNRVGREESALRKTGNRAILQASWAAWAALGTDWVGGHRPDTVAGCRAAERAAQAIEFALPASHIGEEEWQCDLLRDIFGNPFRPVGIKPAWLAWNAGTVRKFAQTIYDERRFGDLPVLADALEEAGCSEAAVLEHCRGPGPHVRGCWVVDLLLGKE